MNEAKAMHVAVLMGGWSAEREVSLDSGKACAAALRECGHKVTEIDMGRDLHRLLDALEPKPDAVFNALHGRYGEDGTVQAILDILQIPYTHSGLLASAVAMDKVQAKKLLADAGVPSPAGTVTDRESLADGPPMAPPCVIKPVNEGSSVGVQILPDSETPIDFGLWQEGQPLLVEEFIPGRELTVAVMGDKALGVTELQPKSGFYDYEAKYTDGKTVHKCPAPVAESVAADAMRFAEQAHAALGCRGVSRADFRYDDTDGEPGKLYMLEVNTQPGMTSLSLVPEQAAAAGISFAALVDWMVQQARFEQ
ncbi:MAG TPA: D-alanine--D-alanine ligase [Rhodospirillaceae bacterium]|nr:D-alanine--D-alanine ligase [Rhodospirillaceae bacterium]HAT35898.1 D-alanine--D-alanine ligase [Rhodospirillaceae bacterium]